MFEERGQKGIKEDLYQNTFIDYYMLWRESSGDEWLTMVEDTNLKDYQMQNNDQEELYMEKITVYDLIQPLIEGTKNFEKFRANDYIRDFKIELQKHLPEYEVDFILVDDDNWTLIPDTSNANTEEEMKQTITEYLTYPMVIGNISNDEKERIVNMLFEDPFLTFHADGDYFESI